MYPIKPLPPLSELERSLLQDAHVIFDLLKQAKPRHYSTLYREMRWEWAFIKKAFYLEDFEKRFNRLQYHIQKMDFHLLFSWFKDPTLRNRLKQVLLHFIQEFRLLIN